jgi:type VI secretion system secreted protein VgrG
MSANTYIASAEITIKGDTIKEVNYVQINQHFGTHHDFEISVAPEKLPGKSVDLQALATKMVGEEITIKLNQSRKDASGKSQTMTFKGIVMSIRLVKGQTHTNTFLISGTSPTVVLSAGRTTRSFTDKKLSDIIGPIVEQFGSLKATIKPSFGGVIPYITQYEEDNFHFLQRLAEKYGEWMYYDGNQLIFGKSGRVSTPAVELFHGQNFFDMEYGVRATPLNFNAYYYNYSLDKFWSSAKSNAATVSGLQTMAQIGYNKSEKLFKDSLIGFGFHEDEQALQQSVKLKKSEQSNKLAIMQGRTREMGIRLGGLIKVRDKFYTATNASQGATLQESTDYGTFVVTRLSNSLDSRGVHWATFEAVPHDTDFAPVDYRIVAPIAQPRMGIVKKVDDEGKMGRVKVDLLWHDTDQTTPWIRVSQLMTGADRGVYFVPEVNEGVFVDFEFGDPDLPFVTGSFHRKKDALPGPLFNKDNNIKGIITRGGNHILINDESGKETIKIFNKDNKNEIDLSLDGDTTITIKSEGKINIEAKDTITMKAKKIEFTADEEWKVKAGKSEIKNDQGMEITAGTELKIQSTSVKVKGDASVEIEADASASLKSKTLVDIESNAMTIVKGMPVLIN